MRQLPVTQVPFFSPKKSNSPIPLFFLSRMGATVNISVVIEYFKIKYVCQTSTETGFLKKPYNTKYWIFECRYTKINITFYLGGGINCFQKFSYVKSKIAAFNNEHEIKNTNFAQFLSRNGKCTYEKICYFATFMKLYMVS